MPLAVLYPILLVMLALPAQSSTLISGLYSKPSQEYQKHIFGYENSFLRQSSLFDGLYDFEDRGFGLAIYNERLAYPIIKKSDKRITEIKNLEAFIPREKASAFIAHLNLNSRPLYGHLNEQLDIDRKSKLKQNIRPLVFKDWCFVNSGFISNFNKIRFDLRRLMSEELVRELIKSDDTALDSRYLFALLLTNIQSFDDKSIKKGVEKSFEQIYSLAPDSQITFILSNGKKMIAARTDNKLANIKTSLVYYYDESAAMPKLLFSTNPTFQEKSQSLLDLNPQRKALKILGVEDEKVLNQYGEDDHFDAFEHWHSTTASEILIGSFEKNKLSLKKLSFKLPDFLDLEFKRRQELLNKVQENNARKVFSRIKTKINP